MDFVGLFAQSLTGYFSDFILILLSLVGNASLACRSRRVLGYCAG